MNVSTAEVVPRDPGVARRALVPLALAQFICSFAGSNMNVMINDISEDLDTGVKGVQVAITLFLLVMAALMIPGGKLTDRWGRQRCLTLGLTIYGVGALLSAVAPGLGILILGNSLLEGIGTALLIPPVYILTTLLFTDIPSRARAFGVISGMGGVGAATGPLLGGLITTTISWRAAFVFQALVVGAIVLLSRGMQDPLPADPDREFDLTGAVLSAAALLLLVGGILLADEAPGAMLALILAGAGLLALFFAHVRSFERSGREPLLATSLFRNRTSNLGLATQHLQWLLLMGVSFVVSVYLQVVRGFDAIQTGVVFTAATVGVLISSLGAQRFAERRSQRSLIIAGFAGTTVGIGLLAAMVAGTDSAWAFVPGLLLIGLGVGLMLTPSVNLVQSSFPDDQQGEISGLSRSVSNLGSSVGTATAGTILVAATSSGDGAFGSVLAVLAVVALAGAAIAWALPRREAGSGVSTLPAVADPAGTTP